MSPVGVARFKENVGSHQILNLNKNCNEMYTYYVFQPTSISIIRGFDALNPSTNTTKYAMF